MDSYTRIITYLSNLNWWWSSYSPEQVFSRNLLCNWSLIGFYYGLLLISIRWQVCKWHWCSFLHILSSINRYRYRKLVTSFFEIFFTHHRSVAGRTNFLIHRLFLKAITMEEMIIFTIYYNVSRIKIFTTKRAIIFFVLLIFNFRDIRSSHEVNESSWSPFFHPS